MDISQLKKLVEEKTKNDKSGHDWNHIQRVLKNADEIAQNTQNIDKEILTISILLHDINFQKENHEVTSANKGKEMLEELNYPKDRIEKVYHCIINHNRAYGKSLPKEQFSPEGKILCDADRLDALGAIGIMRMVQFSTSQNLPFKAEGNKPDQSFYGNTKHLISLADDMLTRAGTEIAKERIKIIEEFLNQLDKENPFSE